MRTPRKQPASLDNSVVLITGAGSGIGAGTARALAARGARLVLCDVDEAGLKDTVAAVGEQRAVADVVDVRDLSALEALVATGVERFGGIDVVMANAGVGSFGSVLHVDPEAFRRVIDINVIGVFHTVRAALPSVVERKGYVLVVSSLAAFTASPAMAAYHASKAAAENFANALRLEVAHQGVDVGSAHMCWVDTPMVQEAKTELSGFARSIRNMPPPLNRTTDLDTCVEAFVDGIARRSRRIYVPGWVGTISRLRSLVNSPLGDRATLTSAPKVLAEVDADAARYGRSLSARMAQHLDRPAR
jgi:NAD(P)-dependent dehydrogenase (short-subunit alcohol dehydrogenase family)